MNPHVSYETTDFKSVLSANSNTPAYSFSFSIKLILAYKLLLNLLGLLGTTIPYITHLILLRNSCYQHPGILLAIKDFYCGGVGRI